LKYVFSKHDKSVNRSELLVFLRPKVVRSPEQARAMLEDVTRKMPLIKGADLDAPPAKPPGGNN